ncbi:hypothetical protein CVT24_009363 [Panaeolus cyanescens]|uniref:Fanconi-associated nuclease n=1 Tax=Panaeolus cyanescens TaxID=181874 RepID=A0A409Y7R1_9AGAR|nr:hypothetical protein CVT24_009363 [Panaeolus cyanescens]
MSASSGRYKQRLIFCGGEPAPTTLNEIDIRLETRDSAISLKQEEVEAPIQSSQETSAPKKQRPKRPSGYVTVFESMIRAVVQGEEHLLSQKEHDNLAIFSLSNYFVRYCLTRLLMRKPKQWIPITSLASFYNEIEEFATPALHFLCLPIDYSVLNEPTREEQEAKVEAVFQQLLAEIKAVNEGNNATTTASDVIDLTLDEEVPKKPFATRFQTPLPPQNAKAGPSRVPSDGEETLAEFLHRDIGEMNLDFFCEDESSMTLDDILNTLNKDQLMEMAQEFKCKLGKSPKKVDILESLHKIALDQGIIKFASPPKKGKKKASKPDGLRQTQLSFAPKKPKESVADRMRARALKKLGPCIRVNYDFYRLAHRLHIICYREMDRPTTLCLPELLSTFKKRHYTAVEHNRTTDIWRKRHDFLDYEKALEINKRLDEELDAIAQMKALASRKTPGPAQNPSEDVSASVNQTTPLRKPTSSISLKEDRETPMMEADNDVGRAASEVPVKTKKEDILKDHLESWLLPKWQELVRAKDEEISANRPPGLERFESGYVYTRLVYKCTAAYGPLKEYHKELEVLEMLLAQKHWRKSKRGEWYERRAVIYGHLARGPEKAAYLSQSLEGLKAALMDEDTGTVYRPKFIKRIAQIEKVLKIPEEEQCKCEGKLKAPNVISINAERVDPENLPEDMQDEADIDEEKENWRDTTLTQYNFVREGAEASSSSSVAKLKEANELSKKKMGKSKWRGRNGTIVDVETRALQHYEDLGLRMHAETSILTMLFALLFWDIIFASVPGAFETPFQTCPLDMFEDAFYYARKRLIEDRLAQIRAGEACEILTRHDDQYRPKGTWCLGVNWERCTKQELLQIVECMGGKSLAHICNLFCQDYSGRSSGGPDLIIWNYSKKVCKFVEVKGPGDTAKANQTLWFDSLKRADSDVDLCKVVDVNEPPKQKKPAKTSSATKRKKTVEPPPTSEPSSEVNYDLLDESDVEDMASPPVPARSAKKRRISTE